MRVLRLPCRYQLFYILANDEEATAEATFRLVLIESIEIENIFKNKKHRDVLSLDFN